MATTGARFSSPANPRDYTAIQDRKIRAEQKAKEAAEKPSVSALDAARLAGFNAGFDSGADAWKSSVVNLYKAEGISAVEEWLKEEIDSATTSNPEHE